MHERIDVNGHTYDKQLYEHPYEGVARSAGGERHGPPSSWPLPAHAATSVHPSHRTSRRSVCAPARICSPPPSDAPGWTVEADDPRAETFLERTVELLRDQNAGRIGVETLHETLRREFPRR